jgi:ferritin-like metal-binding protein YciE
MESEAREHWMAWLRDAHAMEAQAETMLNAQIGRLEHFPTLKLRLEQHLRETEGQRRAVGGLLDSLGEDVSALKATMGKLMALGQGVVGAFAPDEVMKGLLASYTFENLEIGSYTMLIAGAEKLGLKQAVTVLTPVLDQERDMAAWIEENMPSLTHDFLARAETGAEAKR